MENTCSCLCYFECLPINSMNSCYSPTGVFLEIYCKVTI